MFGRTYRSVAILAAAVLTAAPVIRAEEGMWTFDNLPVKQLEAKYGFQPRRSGSITCGCRACGSTMADRVRL